MPLTGSSRGCLHPYAHCSAPHNSQGWEAAHMAVSRRLAKKRGHRATMPSYTQGEGDLSVCNSRRGAGGLVPSEMSQTGRDKYRTTPLLRGAYKTERTNKTETGLVAKWTGS